MPLPEIAGRAAARGDAGAGTAPLPARPEPAGWRDGYDPVRRCLVGYQLFFALIQGAVVGLNCFTRAAADQATPEADEGLALAAAFVGSSAAAMKFASDFAPDDYEATVRPTMAPPRVREGFSGLQTRDHAYLVRVLGAVKPAFPALGGPAGAHQELVDSVVAAYAAHEFICADRGRGDPGDDAGQAGAGEQTMTGPPTVAVALHDGFYGAGTGAGYANRGFLRTLAGLFRPPARLVVLPVCLASDSPQHQAGWHRDTLDICRAAGAIVRPLDNGTRGQVRFGDVQAFQRLAASTADALLDEMPPHADQAAVIFLNIPFLGAAPLLPEQVLRALAVVPRSTGLLHDPANRARIRFEKDGLHYIARHGGRIAAISGYMRDHLIKDYGLPAAALLDLPDGLSADEWSCRQPGSRDLPPAPRADSCSPSAAPSPTRAGMTWSRC